jgi:predicted RNA-binding protein Jag
LYLIGNDLILYSADMLKPTPIHIVERNRRNALQSTGPKTALGKQASRGNALKHGLCANPAVGVVEDEESFVELHEALFDRFQPHDPLEQGLIHRIAVSLWRLQRAAHIEAAASVLQSTAISSASDRVQQWVTEITQKFAAIGWVEVTDKELFASVQSKNQKPKACVGYVSSDDSCFMPTSIVTKS